MNDEAARQVDVLLRRRQRVLVEEDVLYVDDGPLITSAGSAAGMDACLHLVRCDFDARIANTVARAAGEVGASEHDPATARAGRRPT